MLSSLMCLSGGWEGLSSQGKLIVVFVGGLGGKSSCFVVVDDGIGRVIYNIVYSESSMLIVE